MSPRPRTRPGTAATPEAIASPADADQEPRRRSRLGPIGVPPDPSTAPPDEAAPKWVFVEINGKMKRRATGSHENGYCNAPIKNRFQPNCKPGPGRNKGNKSQDTLLRAELDAKQTVRIGGRNKQVTTRALVPALMVKTALEQRDYKLLAALHAEAKRLYPESTFEIGEQSGLDPTADKLDETGESIIAWFSSELIARERGEKGCPKLHGRQLPTPSRGNGCRRFVVRVFAS